jgi:hypothetical protein
MTIGAVNVPAAVWTTPSPAPVIRVWRNSAPERANIVSQSLR